MGHVRCMRKGRKEGLLGVCSCCCFLDLLFIRPLVGLNLNGIYGGHVLLCSEKGHRLRLRLWGLSWCPNKNSGGFLHSILIHTYTVEHLNICRIMVQKKQHQLRFVQCLCVSLNLFGSRSLFSIINPFRQAGDIFHIRSCRRRKNVLALRRLFKLCSPWGNSLTFNMFRTT